MDLVRLEEGPVTLPPHGHPDAVQSKRERGEVVVGPLERHLDGLARQHPAKRPHHHRRPDGPDVQDGRGQDADQDGRAGGDQHAAQAARQGHTSIVLVYWPQPWRFA
jgi:hypothetical protein